VQGKGGPVGNKQLLVCTLVVDLTKVFTQGEDTPLDTAISTLSEAIQFCMPGAVEGRVRIVAADLATQQRYEDMLFADYALKTVAATL
jgi:hypothetical protein